MTRAQWSKKRANELYLSTKKLDPVLARMAIENALIACIASCGESVDSPMPDILSINRFRLPNIASDGRK